MARFCVLAGLFVASLRVSADCITMQKLQENMGSWVGKVPYSHLVNHTWGYPTDCSGFVSWALQANRDIKAYEFSSSNLSSRINIDDLRYGDIITHVWDKTGQNRCSSSAPEITSGLDLNHLSGHVFFFDRWDDSNHSTFWAFESTETQDQTEACLAQRGPLTRSECFNHHVQKSRQVPEKWSKDNCTDSSLGVVTGGPHRLSSTLLCESQREEEGAWEEERGVSWVSPSLAS